MSFSPMTAGLMLGGGLILMVIAIRAPHLLKTQTPSGLTLVQSLTQMLPTIKEGEEQNLRLARVSPTTFAQQRLGGAVLGVVLGLLASLVMGFGPIMFVITPVCVWRDRLGAATAGSARHV